MRKPKGYFKMATFDYSFKVPKELKPKKEREFHIMNYYEENLIKTLCPAILKKQKIKFWYSDKNKDFEDFRIVEPHLIGQNKNTGNILLSAWFLPNQVQIWEGEIATFRSYCLENISQLEFLNEYFKTTRIDYNPDDKTMCKIFCRTQLVQNPYFQ